MDFIFKMMIVSLFTVVLWSAPGTAGVGPSKGNEKVWITVGADALPEIRSALARGAKGAEGLKVYEENGAAAALKVDESDLPLLGQIMHEKFNRCGGFIAHKSGQEAVETLQDFSLAEKMNKEVGTLVEYSITQDNLVVPLLEKLNKTNILEMIKKMSNYNNRYYTSETGIASSKWIKEYWEGFAKGRSDVKVELFNHADYPQQTVIMTIQGERHPDEVVVVGGHADSISGFWNREQSRAPGADDNASGIATITEVIRVFLASGHRPDRTVKFMAYAAEEVGLLGSSDVAKAFKQKGVQVVGVLQLDMTAVKSGDLEIVMMNDYTSTDQNKFLGSLIDHYVHTTWGYSHCGYACSDHASWTKNGYPSSIPFETKMELMNKNIHTERDTLDVFGNNTEHALKFAQLSLAFMIEMAK